MANPPVSTDPQAPVFPRTERNLHWKHVAFGSDQFEPTTYESPDVTINEFGQIVGIGEGTAGADDTIWKFATEAALTTTPDIKQGDVAVVDSPRRVYKAKTTSPSGLPLPMADWELISTYDFGDLAVADTNPLSRLTFKHGNDVDVMNYLPAMGEPVWNKQNDQLHIGDGVTMGGVPIGSAGGGAVFVVPDLPTMYAIPALSSGDVCVVEDTIHGATYKNIDGLNSGAASWQIIAAAAKNLDMGIVL